jgi:hypothetical protein
MNQKYILLLIALFLFSCSDEGVNPVYGCMDDLACNYISNANIDDDSCVYIFSEQCDCDEVLSGTCYCDQDGNVLDCLGVCGGSATIDDCGICNNEFTYSYMDIQDLLSSSTISCFDCHNNVYQAENLNLQSYNEDEVYGILDVLSDCSNIESSLILQKIDGGSMSEYASQDLIDALRVWISEGAPE